MYQLKQFLWSSGFVFALCFSPTTYGEFIGSHKITISVTIPHLLRVDCKDRKVDGDNFCIGNDSNTPYIIYPSGVSSGNPLRADSRSHKKILIEAI